MCRKRYELLQIELVALTEDFVRTSPEEEQPSWEDGNDLGWDWFK